MDILSEQDYVIIDTFLDDALYGTLRNFLLEKINVFDQAVIGTLNQHVIKQRIRGARTYWLNKNGDSALHYFWQLLEETKFIVNRYCYLSLSGKAFHLAHDPSGGHYVRHLNQFVGRNNRTISMVIYLNEDWQPAHGGQLEILDNNKQLK